MPIRWPSALSERGPVAYLPFLLLAFGVRACPLPTELPGEGADARIARWIALEPGCLNDGPFLAHLGHLLNAEGRYGEAADRLERALLLAPDSRDTQLDYVIALAGTGDFRSSRALLDTLLADPELPGPLRAALVRKRSALSGYRWTRHVTLGMVAGYDSNLLGAPNLQSLDLSVSGQTLNLPLSDSYRAQAGRFLRADLNVDVTREEDGGALWDMFGSLRRRISPDVDSSDYSQFNLAVERSDHRETPGPYMNAALSRVEGSLGGLYSLGSLGGGVGIPWGQGCHARAGVESQWRVYPVNRVLDGRYAGFQAQWACYGRDSWALTASAGSDAALSPDRPGGAQRQYELRFTSYVPLAKGTLKADLDLANIRDERGYNPLLGEGRNRTMLRQVARLEFAIPHGRLQVAAGVEYVNQTASIELFRVRGIAPYVSIRHGW